MNHSAVILAGGQSLRMGCDKALLEIGKQPLLARQINLAWTTRATEVFISGRVGVDYSHFKCPVLLDQFPGAGPLAGIERALVELTKARLLVLAVDLPAMTKALLNTMAAAGPEHLGVIPRLNGRIEPLAAFFPKGSLRLAQIALRSSNYSVTAFSQQCVRAGIAKFIEVPARQIKCFTNWNSPTDVGHRELIDWQSSVAGSSPSARLSVNPLKGTI
jgi:molybdopterin-guanine dinucleotide biosynthesis protein A